MYNKGVYININQKHAMNYVINKVIHTYICYLPRIKMKYETDLHAASFLCMWQPFHVYGNQSRSCVRLLLQTNHGPLYVFVYLIDGAIRKYMIMIETFRSGETAYLFIGFIRGRWITTYVLHVSERNEIDSCNLLQIRIHFRENHIVSNNKYITYGQ